MAKETKFIQVGPQEVQTTIDEWQSFGWELLGAPQEIKTQDVQRYAGQSSDLSTSYYKTKKGKHYVKITFQRDKEMTNYQELVILEKTYNEAKDFQSPFRAVEPEYNNRDKKNFPVFFMILSIVGFIISLAVWEEGAGFFWLPVGVIFTIVTIVKIIKRNKQRNEYQEEFNAEMESYRRSEENYPAERKVYEEAVRKAEEALSRAKSLVG